MLAAFEATIQRNAKDENAAQRIMAALTAEPPEVRKQRRTQGSAVPAAGRMSVDDAEAMLARFAATDAAFG